MKQICSLIRPKNITCWFLERICSNIKVIFYMLFLVGLSFDRYPKSVEKKIDWLIDWIWLYRASAIFQNLKWWSFSSFLTSQLFLPKSSETVFPCQGGVILDTGHHFTSRSMDIKIFKMYGCPIFILCRDRKHEREAENIVNCRCLGNFICSIPLIRLKV